VFTWTRPFHHAVRVTRATPCSTRLNPDFPLAMRAASSSRDDAVKVDEIPAPGFGKLSGFEVS